MSNNDNTLHSAVIYFFSWFKPVLQAHDFLIEEEAEGFGASGVFPFKLARAGL